MTSDHGLDDALARESLAAAALDALGIQRLRPEQEEAILSIVQGRDTVVIMPTGAGKSAIYQLAASLIPGPTIVISPLIALQRDQAESLADANAGEAVTLNSSLPESRQEELIASLEAGEIEFIFMAPEQLQKPEVVKALRSARPSLFVVDEAHCIVEWGHDFRPDYMALRPVIESLERPTIVALTATAALPVREEFIASLGMSDPTLVVAGLDRPNIHLAVQRFDDEHAKDLGLHALIEALPGPGIVYCSTRKATEQVAESLNEANVPAMAYHAGLRASERNQIQDAFMAGDTPVLAATKAFGLGIDKPDIRFVIHYDAPESLDSLYQEVGRAGRDGLPADAIFLYHPPDLRLPQFFAGGGLKPEQVNAVLMALNQGSKTRSALAEVTGLSARTIGRIVNHLVDLDAVRVGGRGRIQLSQHRLDRVVSESQTLQEQRQHYLNSRIDMVRGYAETETCRRQLLLSYFGEAIEPCGNCDNCERGVPVEDQATTGDGERVVEHREWGKGSVLRIESNRAYIFFASVGYRAVDLDIAEENDLLQWGEE